MHLTIEGKPRHTISVRSPHAVAARALFPGQDPLLPISTCQLHWVFAIPPSPREAGQRVNLLRGVITHAIPRGSPFRRPRGRHIECKIANVGRREGYAPAGVSMRRSGTSQMSATQRSRALVQSLPTLLAVADPVRDPLDG